MNKPRIADMLKRAARALTRLANRIDGPKVTVYNKHWQPLSSSGHVNYTPSWALDDSRGAR